MWRSIQIRREIGNMKGTSLSENKIRFSGLFDIENLKGKKNKNFPWRPLPVSLDFGTTTYTP